MIPSIELLAKRKRALAAVGLEYVKLGYTMLLKESFAVSGDDPPEYLVSFIVVFLGGN